MMTSTLDLTTDRCLQRLVAAFEAGEDIRACIIEVYCAFARDAAERWHLTCHKGAALEPHAAQLAEMALREQLDMLPRLNFEYLGDRDRAFDGECAAATQQAFNERRRELLTGWSE